MLPVEPPRRSDYFRSNLQSLMGLLTNFDTLKTSFGCPRYYCFKTHIASDILFDDPLLRGRHEGLAFCALLTLSGYPQSIVSSWCPRHSNTQDNWPCIQAHILQTIYQPQHPSNSSPLASANLVPKGTPSSSRNDQASGAAVVAKGSRLVCNSRRDRCRYFGSLRSVSCNLQSVKSSVRTIAHSRQWTQCFQDQL